MKEYVALEKEKFYRLLGGYELFMRRARNSSKPCTVLYYNEFDRFNATYEKYGLEPALSNFGEYLIADDPNIQRQYEELDLFNIVSEEISMLIEEMEKRSGE